MSTGPVSVDLLELAAAACAGGVVGWFLHRALARARGPVLPSVTVPADPVVPASGTGRPVDKGPVSMTQPGSIAPPPAVAPSAANRSVEAEGLGLARRVVLHLSFQGRLGPDEVAPVGFTQQGMAASLSVRQGNLSKVLQRLVAAGALEVDRRHVRGVDRRLNVYRLTALGESISRDLRRRRGGSAAPVGAPSPPGTRGPNA